MQQNATFRPAMMSKESQRVRVQQILQAARLFLPCRVVDLGTGSGLIGLQIRDAGGDVTLVDCSPKRLLPEAKPLFVRADVPDVPLTKFDLIVCAGLLYHMNLSTQIRFAEAVRRKPVILDTHFSLRPDTARGDYLGQFRKPSASTQGNRPFVHTIDSLRVLFPKHEFSEPFQNISLDRKVMILKPR